jgi:hypothetical protein
LAALVVAVVTTACLGAGAAGAGALSRPGPVHVFAGNESVRAAQGSYCVSQTDFGMCADYGYPLRVRQLLPVKPGDLLRIRTAHRATRVGVGLLRVRRGRIRHLPFSKSAPAANGAERDWLVRLPRRLHQSNRLDISVIFGGGRVEGDSNYWAGLTRAR